MSPDIAVAVDLVVDSSWDRERFETTRQWWLQIPEVVNISVTTPYPSTEIWQTEQRKLTTRDYRLFDIQHAVLPTARRCSSSMKKLVKTQQVPHREHPCFAAIRQTVGISSRPLLRGHTNFLRMDLEVQFGVQSGIADGRSRWSCTV